MLVVVVLTVVVTAAVTLRLAVISRAEPEAPVPEVVTGYTPPGVASAGIFTSPLTTPLASAVSSAMRVRLVPKRTATVALAL